MIYFKSLSNQHQRKRNTNKQMFSIVKFIPKINEKLEQFKTSIQTIINDNEEYMKSIKRYEHKNFVVEKVEESLKKTKMNAETILDQLEEIDKRIDLEMKNVETFELKIDELRNEIDTFKSKINDEKQLYEKKTKETGEILIETLEQLQKNKIKMYVKIIDEIKTKTNNADLNIDKILKKTNLEKNELKQLEQWTNKQCGEIIFDSTSDNWSQNPSVFDDRVMNKNNLVFIVEDTQNNKFGGYITSSINQYGYINDNNAFVFSLKSNGRINGMRKFNVTKPQYAYVQFQKNSGTLFGIGGGHDICVRQNGLNGSYCGQHSYNYEGISNALCSGYNFTPKRVIVIQMK